MPDVGFKSTKLHVLILKILSCSSFLLRGNKLSKIGKIYGLQEIQLWLFS